MVDGSTTSMLMSFHNLDRQGWCSLSRAPVSCKAFVAEPCSQHPGQVPATWAGSSATIALVPHTCLIFPENNTLACSPAQLVLYNTAGAPQGLRESKPQAMRNAFSACAQHHGVRFHCSKDCELGRSALSEDCTKILQLRISRR